MTFRETLRKLDRWACRRVGFPDLPPIPAFSRELRAAHVSSVEVAGRVVRVTLSDGEGFELGADGELVSTGPMGPVEVSASFEPWGSGEFARVLRRLRHWQARSIVVVAGGHPGLWVIFEPAADGCPTWAMASFVDGEIRRLGAA